MDHVVFLDRDGTINQEVHYLHRTEDLKILPGVFKALRCLRDAGFKLVVITNQAGVARGYYGCEEVEKLHEYMNQMLKPYGAWIDKFFYCPHHPEYGTGIYRRNCRCRKPGIGMFEMAEETFAVDKHHSYMVGDKMIDVQAGINYGIPGILVGTGYGTSLRQEMEEKGEKPLYDFFAETLVDAAEYIIDRENKARQSEKGDDR
ncbi:MAG: HAD family hydrolase [Hungatella sp.]|nr:HAD family hydrolase [Hungatella sp.]